MFMVSVQEVFSLTFNQSSTCLSLHLLNQSLLDFAVFAEKLFYFDGVHSRCFLFFESDCYSNESYPI